MHPALVRFLEEYQTWLNATKKSIKTTQAQFIEIQNEIRNNGYSEKTSTDLFRTYHTLFQTAYLLMESHLRVKNLYANYSDENKQIIDEYDNIEKTANQLVSNIISYKATLENKTEDTISL